MKLKAMWNQWLGLPPFSKSAHAANNLGRRWVGSCGPAAGVGGWNIFREQCWEERGLNVLLEQKWPFQGPLPSLGFEEILEVLPQLAGGGWTSHALHGHFQTLLELLGVPQSPWQTPSTWHTSSCPLPLRTHLQKLPLLLFFSTAKCCSFPLWLVCLSCVPAGTHRAGNGPPLVGDKGYSKFSGRCLFVTEVHPFTSG